MKLRSCEKKIDRPGCHMTHMTYKYLREIWKKMKTVVCTSSSSSRRRRRRSSRSGRRRRKRYVVCVCVCMHVWIHASGEVLVS
jgi:hypothetical protein